jgi:hypothetical protein
MTVSIKSTQAGAGKRKAGDALAEAVKEADNTKEKKKSKKGKR